mmetsp:Transcript_66000/g.137828  ORF Transcript_66000/g.137828 Transcript_66000/m.137828 type:complete len:272 (-) Transcript_66000:147-962(-)
MRTCGRRMKQVVVVARPMKDLGRFDLDVARLFLILPKVPSCSEDVGIGTEGAQRVVVCQVHISRARLADSSWQEGSQHVHEATFFVVIEWCNLNDEQVRGLRLHLLAAPNHRCQGVPIFSRAEGQDWIADAEERRQPLPEVRPETIPDDARRLSGQAGPAEDPRLVVAAQLQLPWHGGGGGAAAAAGAAGHGGRGLVREAGGEGAVHVGQREGGEVGDGEAEGELDELVDAEISAVAAVAGGRGAGCLLLFWYVFEVGRRQARGPIYLENV